MKKIVPTLICLTLLTVLTASAQSPLAMQDRPGYIGLFVTDLEGVLPWYTDQLGFKVLQQQKRDNQFAFAMIEGYGLWIELIQNPKAVSRKKIQQAFTESSFTEGLFKIGFRAASLRHLEELEKGFKNKGVSFKYEKMRNHAFDMTLFILEDPEGNWLQFYYTPQQQ